MVKKKTNSEEEDSRQAGRGLTQGQCIPPVHLPGVEGLAVGVDQLLHLQVLSQHRHPRGLQCNRTDSIGHRLI